MRRRRGQRSIETTRDHHSTHLMVKKDKYIHEKNNVQCSNAKAFAVGNVDVFEGPFTLESDGFVNPPLFFDHFGEYI